MSPLEARTELDAAREAVRVIDCEIEAGGMLAMPNDIADRYNRACNRYLVACGQFLTVSLQARLRT